MQRRCRPASTQLARAALLSAGLTGAAGAQLCEWPAEIMDVRMGTSARGEWLVRRAPDGSRVWIERGALGAGEGGYVARDLPCPDGEGTLIREELAWTVDEAALQLTFTPNVTLLPVVTVRPEWPSGALPGEWAVVTVPVSAQVSGTAGGHVSGTLGIRPSYRTGPVTVSGQLDTQATDGQIGVSGVLGATVRLAGTEIGAQVQRNAAGLSAAAHVTAAHVSQRTLPPVTVPVPLGGSVTVQVDGNTAVPVTAAPGTLILTGIPLPDRAGEVQVTVREEAGLRTISTAFPAPRHSLNPGDWRAAAEATVTPGGASFQVRAAFAAGSWLWSTQGVLSGAGPGAGVTGTYRNGPVTLALTAETSRNGDAWASRFGASYRTQGEVNGATWHAGLHGTWGTQRDGAGAGVDLGLSANRWQVRAAGDWTAGGTEVSLSGQWQARPDLRIRAGGRWTAQEQTWQLGVTWQVAPGTDIEALTGERRALNVTYRPAEPWTVQAQVTPGESLLGVTGGSTARIGASVTTRGTWQANLSSVLVSTGGLSRWSRTGDSGVVAVQTGLPDLLLLLDGRPAGRTDARGTLLLAGVTPGTPHTLSVQVNDLPIEVLVGQDRLTFTLQDTAGTQVDWHTNFRRLRTVTFLARPDEPAAFGTVRAAGQEWALDSLGRTLLPPEAGQGQLVWNDRSCPVTWTATDGTATCS
ncbi:hypothetical protein [Deinococcus depolymerans]|uniref:Uncharacterized protein n=1 Tax=Deinococcus depolymerans TaxID=392408 RepID=A0ABN1BMX8_9DEIO